MKGIKATKKDQSASIARLIMMDALMMCCALLLLACGGKKTPSININRYYHMKCLKEYTIQFLLLFIAEIKE